MSIGVKSRKMLWGRSGNRCSHPDCRVELVMDGDGNSGSIIGDECHIVAESAEGPRCISELSTEERDDYNNLLLLCKNHHKMIDDDPNHFTVGVLHIMKKNHEKWVSEALSLSKRDQEIDETYSTFIDYWCDTIEINNWEGWTSSLLSPQVAISKYHEEKLYRLNKWFLSRIWPAKYTNLENAFENFNRVLNDFRSVFHCYSEARGDWFVTDSFYRTRDPLLYPKLLDQYQDHIDLVSDLVLEMTRAANYICDMIRINILSNFRIKEGALLVYSDSHVCRTEYREEERVTLPYKDLETFILQRVSRDVHFAVKLKHNEYSIDISRYLRER